MTQVARKRARPGRGRRGSRALRGGLAGLAGLAWVAWVAWIGLAVGQARAIGEPPPPDAPRPEASARAEDDLGAGRPPRLPPGVEPVERPADASDVSDAPGTSEDAALGAPPPEPESDRIGEAQVEAYRELLLRVTSDVSDERVAAIRELGRARPRVRRVAELMRQLAWQDELPAEREAARAALGDMGVELGEPPATEASWLAEFSKKTLLKSVRRVLETMQTPNPDRDILEEYDRRFDRQREMSEIGEEEAPR